MKRVNFLFLSLFAIGLTLSCSKNEVQTSDPEISPVNVTTTGNNAPSGPHYNLNIIGVDKEKTADMTGNNGHRIFVALWGKSKINLIEGDDFQVLDANGTDGEASFQLPNPDEDGDGMTSYSIWIRALGGPGGKTTITTCADADLTADGYYEVCSSENIEVERSKRPKFEDVSRTLLTINVPEDIVFTNNEGQEVTIPSGRYTIFDEIFEDYFWSYDNEGLKLLQMRFYEVPADIT